MRDGGGDGGGGSGGGGSGGQTDKENSGLLSPGKVIDRRD